MTGVAGPASELCVHGGPGGTFARLEDLDRAGVRLQAAADAMASVAVRLARLALDLEGHLSMIESPGTWLAVQRRLVSAVASPAGVVAVAARLTALGAAARAAAAAYRTADASADAGLHAINAAVGRALGRLLTVPAVASFVISPVAVNGAVLEMVALNRYAEDLAGESGATVAQRTMRSEAAEKLLGLLAAHPGIAEHTSDAVPGLIGGVVDSVPGLGFVLAAATGMPDVPTGLPEAAAWLTRLTASGPWFGESGRVKVVAVRPSPVRPPEGVEDIVAGVASLGPVRGTPAGTVRVVGMDRPDGRRSWIVHVPGTNDWSPRAGQDPFDLTGNVHGMAGQPTAGRHLVVSALRVAGAAPHEQVLLAGHSQGGLVAAQLAADPAFREEFRVTHVLTVGAPVASVPVPDTVAVLSLEHDEDVVPRLDGAANPDRAEWITVSRSTAAPGTPADPSAAHGLSTYLPTAGAVDRSPDPGLTRWRQGLEPFLTGPGVGAAGLEVTGRRERP